MCGWIVMLSLAPGGYSSENNLLASLLAARWEDGELGDSLFEVRCASRGERCRLVHPVSAGGWESKHCWKAEQRRVCDCILFDGTNTRFMSSPLSFWHIQTHRWGYTYIKKEKHTYSIHKLALLHNKKSSFENIIRRHWSAWGCIFTLNKPKYIVDFLDNTPNPSVIALLPLREFTPLCPPPPPHAYHAPLPACMRLECVRS